MYNIKDENSDFKDAIERLKQLFIRVEGQIEYYKSVHIGYVMFVGKWTDCYGDLTKGDGSDKFRGGADVNIEIDGTWGSGSFKDGDAWFDGRNTISLEKAGVETDNEVLFVDGNLVIETKVTGMHL